MNETLKRDPRWLSAYMDLRRGGFSNAVAAEKTNKLFARLAAKPIDEAARDKREAAANELAGDDY